MTRKVCSNGLLLAELRTIVVVVSTVAATVRPTQMLMYYWNIITEYDYWVIQRRTIQIQDHLNYFFDSMFFFFLRRIRAISMLIPTYISFIHYYCLHFSECLALFSEFAIFAATRLCCNKDTCLWFKYFQLGIGANAKKKKCDQSWGELR